MAFAYAVTNLLAPLSSSAFTITTGTWDSATIPYLNDGRLAGLLRCTSSTANTVTIDMGAATAISGFAILNHNLGAGSSGTCTVTATNDVTWATGIVTPKASSSLVATAPADKDAVLQFASTSKRYWRLAFTHSAQALTIGELIAYSSATQLSRGMLDGSGDGLEIVTTSTKMLYGERVSTFFGGPLRSKTMRFADFTEAQTLEMQTLFLATRGHVTPVLWINSYEAVSTAAAATERDCIYGKVQLERFDSQWVDHLYKQVPELTVLSLGREAGS